MIQRVLFCCISLALMLSPVDAMATEKPELHINFQYDVVNFDDVPDTVDDESGFRRRRVALDWKATDWLAFKFEHDFQSHAWTDAHARIKTGAGNFLLGQFKQPFSLETMGSNKNRLFMESAFSSVFGIDRRVGLGYQWFAPSWSLAAGLYGKNLTGENEGGALVVRGVWNPVSDAERILHLGAATGRERPDDGVFSRSTRPETGLGPLRLARTGTITGVDEIDRFGLEGAWRNGPLLVQGEYAHLLANRDGGGDVDADGAYLSVGYVFTGEMHQYKEGAFGTVKPASKWGALEGVARIARIDFDGGTSGTDGHDSLTLGLNWYVTDRTRLQLNYVRAEQDGTAPLLVDPEVFQVRAQIGF
ncbi:MAG TPA: porin [Xanthomonadaceae bacterium]|nr:porin [Xanthomonadaceae bacterium]